MKTSSIPSGLKLNPPANRLVGDLPKIGIRPTIDGRLHGVRESLEKTTMGMAQNVARLIESSLRHANGLPVECVIADTCIGGVAEAALAAEKFLAGRRRRVADRHPVLVLRLRDHGHGLRSCPRRSGASTAPNARVRCIWPPSAPATPRRDCPRSRIYGRDVQNIGDTDNSGRCARKNPAASSRPAWPWPPCAASPISSVGGVSMGIAGSIVNQDLFEDYLGMRVECVDMTELVRRIEEKIYDEQEFTRALAWVKKNCPEGKDYNPAAARPQDARTGSGNLW